MRGEGMNKRLCLIALAAVAAPLAGVSALTPPSKADGPIRLLSCVVSPTGVLEAEVDNHPDSAQLCNVRCNFAIGETTFSHWFEVSIPARFNGRVGRFDTTGGKAGNYSGDVGTCEKTAAHG
jgi:hypothetical protein